MELDEVIVRRKSVRSFQDRPVEEEKIRHILENAIKAPSAGNLQPWEFILVRDEGVKEGLVRAALHQTFIAEAPLVIVVCANRARSGWRYGRRGAELYSIIDASLAAGYIMLTATDLGLGSVYIGAFDENRVSRLLGLPEEVRPIGIIPIGYPAESPYPTSRFPLEKVVHHDHW